MSSVDRIPSSRLPRAQRDELEAILRAHRQGPSGDAALRERFHSDYLDALPWWMTLILLSIAGIVGAGTQIGGWTELSGWLVQSLKEGYYMGALHLLQWPAAILACLGIIGWSAWVWFANHRRRGVAITSFALVRVKGRRVALLRHADVAGLEWTRHSTRTQSFSVLTLKAGDGRTLTLYATGRWVGAALEELDRARKEAGLPPIEGDARKLPG